MALGRYTEAMQVFERASALAPEDAHFVLARVLLGCASAEVPVPQRREAQAAVRGTPLRPGIVNLLDDVVGRLERGECDPVGTEYALGLIDELLANPRTSGSYRRDGLHLKARLHALQRNLDGAVRALEAADEVSPSLVSVQRQAAWLLSADLYDDALRAIRKGRLDPRWRPWQRVLYATFFDGYERQVRDAAKARGVALRDGT
jgi:tetratricopeptide (TPR) repeat protein